MQLVAFRRLSGKDEVAAISAIIILLPYSPSQPYRRSAPIKNPILKKLLGRLKLEQLYKNVKPHFVIKAENILCVQMGPNSQLVSLFT